MKKTVAAILLGGLCVVDGTASAETNAVARPAAPGPGATLTSTNMLSKPPPRTSRRRGRARAQYSGALPQAVQSGNPAQLINPMAPARFGSGTENVVIDPVTGKPAGVALFRIRF